MDFKNVDLSNIKIPDYAQGKVVPLGILKQMAEDEKRKNQRKIDLIISVSTLILSAIGIVVTIVLN